MASPPSTGEFRMADAGQSLFLVAFVPISTSCRLSAGCLSREIARPDLTLVASIGSLSAELPCDPNSAHKDMHNLRKSIEILSKVRIALLACFLSANLTHPCPSQVGVGEQQACDLMLTYHPPLMNPSASSTLQDQPPHGIKMKILPLLTCLAKGPSRRSMEVRRASVEHQNPHKSLTRKSQEVGLEGENQPRIPKAVPCLPSAAVLRLHELRGPSCGRQPSGRAPALPSRQGAEGIVPGRPREPAPDVTAAAGGPVRRCFSAAPPQPAQHRHGPPCLPGPEPQVLPAGIARPLLLLRMHAVLRPCLLLHAGPEW